MRRRDAICAGIDLDPVPARPRRPRAGEPGRKPKRVGAAFTPSLQARWRDWAAPNGAKRKALEAGKLGDFFGFVNGDLIPHLKSLVQKPNATARQKIIGEALSGVEKTRVDTEKNLLDVLDRVDALNLHAADGTHMFPLSQVYEGLLLKMGDKGNDGGQFFTPREVIRAIVRAIDPKPGETIYDPCCGTGGFLAESFKHVRSHFKADATVDEVEALGTRTLFGREKEDLVYPLALANLILHGVDRPHIRHGNTLTGGATYDGLWRGVPSQFDIVLTNPPFRGKEGKEAQSQFVSRLIANHRLLAVFESASEVRALSSAGITRPHRSYDPVWARWSRGWLYQTLKLFNGYRVVRPAPKAAPAGSAP